MPATKSAVGAVLALVLWELSNLSIIKGRLRIWAPAFHSPHDTQQDAAISRRYTVRLRYYPVRGSPFGATINESSRLALA